MGQTLFLWQNLIYSIVTENIFSKTFINKKSCFVAIEELVSCKEVVELLKIKHNKMKNNEK